MQKIEVRISVTRCGSGVADCPAERCLLTINYFELLGIVPPHQTTLPPVQGVANIDTWDWGTIAGSRSSVTMEGAVKAFRYEGAVKETLDQWTPGVFRQRKTGEDEFCRGISWTSGGYKSADKFTHWSNRDLVEESETFRGTIVEKRRVVVDSSCNGNTEGRLGWREKGKAGWNESELFKFDNSDGS